MARSRLIALFALAMAVAIGFQASVTSAADVTGTWKWERTRNDRTFTSTLTLKADGSRLTGTYEGSRGEPVKIGKGKIDGDKIAFQVTREFNGNEFVMKYRGKISGGRIIGEIEFTTRNGDTRSFEWEAERVLGPSDVVGTWLFEMERNGNVFETRLEVTQAGGKLAGVYTGRRSGRKVKEIGVKDGQLRFVYTGERNGTDFTVTYVGKIDGNTIKGTVEYAWDGDTRSRDFTGKRKVAPAVAGTWVWERTFGDRTINRKLVLAIVDGKLTGTFGGGRGDPVKIEKAVMDGNTIAFTVTREFNGNEFVSRYKGKVTKDRIVGTRESERNGETRTRDWEAKRASD